MLKNNSKITYSLYDKIITFIIATSIIFSLSSLNKYSASILLPISLLIFSRKNNHLKNLNSFYYIILLGLLSSFYSNNFTNYYFVKDFVFFSQVPIIIVLGFYVGKRFNLSKKIIKFFVLAYCFAMLKDFIVVIFNLDEFLADPIIFHNTNKTNSVNAILVLIIILYNKTQKINLYNKFYLNFVILISFSYIILSFSRTTIVISFLVILIYNIGYKKKKKLFYIILLTPIIVQFASLIINLDNLKPDKSETTFTSKLVNSLNELQIVEFDNQFDISHNWRGYEAFLGIEKYFSGDILQLLIGQGFGANIEVPNWAFSDWNDPSLEGLKNPSIFHIGYITIILKTGIVGLFIFVYFLGAFFNKSKLHLFNNFLSQSLIILIVTTTFLTHGLIKPDLNPLILILLGMSFSSVNYNKS
jgi:hypothetical protein